MSGESGYIVGDVSKRRLVGVFRESGGQAKGSINFREQPFCWKRLFSLYIKGSILPRIAVAVKGYGVYAV